MDFHLAPHLAQTCVLLTGAAGFVGRSVAERLIAMNARVHGVSRGAGPDDGGALAWHRCDLSDAEAVRGLVAEVEPESIIHLGALVDGRPDAELVLPSLTTNVVGTVNLLEAARELAPDAPFVVGGTMMEPQPGEPTDVAGSPYAMSKWAASSYARMYHDLYDLPTSVLRLHMVYGPGQRDARKILAHVALSLLQGRSPSLSSGQWETDWIYIDDVVDAVLAAASRPDAAGAAVDVGSGRSVTVREVVNGLVAAMGCEGEPRWGALPDRPHEHPRTADASTWETLGWRPATGLLEGLRHTADWFREEFDRGAEWTGERPPAQVSRNPTAATRAAS